MALLVAGPGMCFSATDVIHKTNRPRSSRFAGGFLSATLGMSRRAFNCDTAKLTNDIHADRGRLDSHFRLHLPKDCATTKADLP